MKPQYIAAIDQGTTSTRCVVFGVDGKPVSVDQKEHTQFFPKPGWVEHDPVEIWNCTCEVVAGAMRKAGLSPADIMAIGIANQRETTILWDRATGKPLCNAIVWQDTRTDSICEALSTVEGRDRFRTPTGLPLATYFSGPKIRWVLDNIARAQARAEKGGILFGNIDTWLIWNLTGGANGGIHITDVTNASRTLLMNLETLDWDPEILAVLGIPRRILPAIRPSSARYGTARVLLPRVPIAGDLGDQQAALFGQTCFRPGEAKNTYGTGCFLLLNTGARRIESNTGLLTTVAYQIEGQQPVYALEGSVAIAGALVQWLRDNLGLIENSQDVEPLARTVEDNGGVYFVPAFSGLFAPYWRSDARGAILGLTRFATKGHIARAALEATAFQTRDVLAAMQEDAGVALSELRVDGGMVNNDLLMQFQADILGIPAVRPQLAETTALGAAYAAGLAVGLWDDTDSLRASWRASRSWQPRMREERREELYSRWLKAVSRSFNWLD